MRYRYKLWDDKLLLLTLIVFFYAYSSPVRVATRAALEGRDFSWAYVSGIASSGGAAVASGRGLFGHTDYILFLAFAVAWLLCMGLRKPDGHFRAGLAGWTSIGFGVGLWLAIRMGDRLTVGKQTLGLADLSFLWTQVAPAGAAWLLAAILLVRGERGGSPPRAEWTRLNALLMAAAAGFLVLAAVLLNVGPQHGRADFHGVGMMYFGFTLLMLGLSPWEARPRDRRDVPDPGGEVT